MPPRTRKSSKADRVVRDEEIEILPPRRTLPLDWSVIVPTVASGTVIGFAASLIVGGGGLIRHAVVGVLGMLVGQGRPAFASASRACGPARPSTCLLYTSRCV